MLTTTRETVSNLDDLMGSALGAQLADSGRLRWRSRAPPHASRTEHAGA